MTLSKETLKDDLLLAPIEILGLQSVFSTIFHISHNDGTWFVSCLMLCYLIYPYIQEILKQIQIKSKMLLLLLMGFILLYSPFIVSTYRTASIYSNPFFRVLEFCIGVTIASAIFDNDNNIKSLAIFKIDPLKLFIIELIFFVVGVTYAVKMSIYKGFMLYSWIGTRIGLPMFALQIITAGNILGEYRNSVFCSVKYFCDISYAFFFAQFFTWPTTVFITQIFGVKINIYRIIIALIVNITYSILFHEMAEKPITAFFKNRFKLS